MLTPAIRPTVTQQVRAFLAKQGVNLRPWSSIDETYGELYCLLNEKREDPNFWDPLKGLMHSIIENAVEKKGSGDLPAPSAELLNSWDVDRLIDDLREALPGGKQVPDRTVVQRFLSTMTAPVLGGFMLLALAAAGCKNASDVDTNSDTVGDLDTDTDSDTDTESDTNSDSDTESESESDWFEGCKLDPNSELYKTIEQSDLSTDTKHLLCICFTTLIESWTDGLIALFENGTPEEVAAALEAMVECCIYDKDDVLSQEYTTEFQNELLNGELCASVAPYMGVSFPN